MENFGIPMMGKEEMNLAEIPFTLLSNRQDSRDELKIKIKVFDQGKMRDGNIRVQGDPKAGLPVASDEEVMLALFKVAKDNYFTSRKIEFSGYHLVNLLGWGDQGYSYKRLRESLLRLMHVTVTTDAWWDNVEGEFVEQSFHILNKIVFGSRETKRTRYFFFR